mgnify:CR=1 FL=1
MTKETRDDRGKTHNSKFDKQGRDKKFDWLRVPYENVLNCEHVREIKRYTCLNSAAMSPWRTPKWRNGCGRLMNAPVTSRRLSIIIGKWALLGNSFKSTWNQSKTRGAHSAFLRFYPLELSTTDSDLMNLELHKSVEVQTVSGDQWRYTLILYWTRFYWLNRF